MSQVGSEGDNVQELPVAVQVSEAVKLEVVDGEAYTLQPAGLVVAFQRLPGVHEGGFGVNEDILL